MCKLSRVIVSLTVISLMAVCLADTGESTRIVDSKQHNLSGSGRNQYRVKSDYVMKELDLKPGDVVTRVNGHSIERPEQALKVWNGLRVASELFVEYERDGRARSLRWAIVDP